MTADLLAPLIMAVLILVSGLISGSETAIFSLDPNEIDEAPAGPRASRFAQLVKTLLREDQRTLLTILIVNNLVNIAYFALASWWAGRQHDPVLAVVIAAGALCVIVLCGEILPKVLASAAPRRAAGLLSPLLYLLVLFWTPVCRLVERLFPAVAESSPQLASEMITNDELKHVIEASHKEGVVSELAHDRLLEIIDLSKTPVYQEMTHRVDIPAVSVEADEEVVRTVLRANPHPYLLVTDDNEDCVGLLTAQDVLRGGRAGKRMRHPLFIPEGCLLPQAITLLQGAGATVGVVVDEYGGTAGLLTLSHIGNALLGAGRSEDLPAVAEPQRLDEVTWQISGQMPLEAWEGVIDINEHRDYSTIGGFITHNLGAVPECGDRLLYRNLQFEVVAVSQHRIASLRVCQLPAEEARRMSRVEPGR